MGQGILTLTAAYLVLAALSNRAQKSTLVRGMVYFLTWIFASLHDPSKLRVKGTNNGKSKNEEINILVKFQQSRAVK